MNASISLPKNGLKQDKLLNMRKAISIQISKRPYSLGGFLMGFSPYKPVGLPTVPPDDMFDTIEFAITCNENISDVEVHLRILATRGYIMAALDTAQEQLAHVG